MAIIKIKNPAIDLDAAEIPNLPATKITSGTFDNARISLDAAEIPNLDTAKITTGTIATARLGSGTANATTFLRGDNTFAEAGGGKVLQAVTGTSSTASQGTETSFTDTGLNVTITPSATSSKILIMAHTTGLIDTSGSFVYFTIERQISGGSDTNIGDSSIGLSHMRGDTVNISNVMVHALDSPSTTSAITYEFQRRVSADSGAAMYQGVKSNITALEIGA
tara:strand:+ start:326 stop:991 length:666 start_codon:yes stop_codon:yes gene_type:complete